MSFWAIDHSTRRAVATIIRTLWSILCVMPASGTAFPAVAAAQSLSFNTVQALIAQGSIHTLEQLLVQLPDSARQNYVLVFDSRSLQSSSYDNPRVLLFNDNADFIITFNGDARQRGFNDLETMEFDRKQRQFVFREIEFADPASSPSAAVRISPANPAKCTACHGVPAHPVWDSFPQWPGVYGETYLRPISTAETAGLKRFAETQATHPRYRYLQGVEQYVRPSTFNPDAAQRYSGATTEPPNARLSLMLEQLNFQAITSQLSDTANFELFQYALLASLEPDCGAVDEFLPAHLRADLVANIPAFAARANAANRIQIAAKQTRLHAAHAEYSSNLDDPLLQFRYLAESGLGVNSANWTMALEKSSYDYATLGSATKMLEQALLPLMAHHDPRLPELRRDSELSDSSKYCRYLRQRSLSGFSAATPSSASLGTRGSANLAGNPPATVAECILCHQDGSVGPAIPFARTEQLVPALQKRGYAHGTLLDEISFRLSEQAGSQAMPKGRVMSVSDKRLLIEYFQSLGH